MSSPTSPRQVTDDLVAPIFEPIGTPRSMAMGGAFLASAGAAGLLGLAVAAYVAEGYGIFGVNQPVNWGNDIASYIFWIGIAVAGTLVSSILLLFRQRWRTGVNRATEAMTVFAINIAGIYPLIHTGRPWVDYWLIPMPNDLGLWPQYKSAIVWDVFAITGYATASVLFFYYGLIPDLAAVRDRCDRSTRFGRLQHLAYRLAAAGWQGSARDWHHYERAYTQFAWIATPLVIGMHSTIATLLAVSHVPGWHATVFPPYFVSGAIFGGLAMAILILVPLRAALKLEAYITIDHLERLAKIMLACGLIVAYVYGMEFFSAWWSENPYERDQYLYRLTGEQRHMFWAMLVCNLGMTQLLWFRALRRNLAVLVLVAVAVNCGMWLERYNIIVLSLQHEYAPTQWCSYRFTAWDYILLAGSFGMFFSQFLLFARFAPVVSIAEIKATLFGGHAGVGGGKGEAGAAASPAAGPVSPSTGLATSHLPPPTSHRGEAAPGGSHV